jgi:endonuclease
MLYDKPVWKLVGEAASALEPPFAPRDIQAWFAEHYPDVKKTTVSAHVIGLTANDTNRRHYRWLASKSPLFFKLSHVRLTHYDPEAHGRFSEGGEPTSSAPIGMALDADDADMVSENTEEAFEFALEVYLEEFLLSNWTAIDWGRPLALWEGSDGTIGHQFSTPVGRLDFLTVDREANTLVAIELKRGRPTDQAVGQVARYMGWLRQNLAGPQQSVEGIIVAQEADDRLTYAASVVPGLSVMVYSVSFELLEADFPGSS